MKRRIPAARLMYSLVAILFLFSFSACNKYSFMPMEEKIVGRWQFDDVKYRSGTWARQQNITNEYRNWEYEFKMNGDFIMRKLSNREEYIGRWNISSVTAGIDQPETVYMVHISVVEPGTSNIDQYVWEINSLGSRTFRAMEYWGNESWEYKMTRM